MPLYYTLQYNNVSGVLKPLEFNASFQRPLIENPQEWDVSVIRFKIPNYETPIFTFTDNLYYMSLEYNGTYARLPVKYIPQNDAVNNRHVFEIQGFIAMLNYTIKNGDPLPANCLYNEIQKTVMLPTSVMPYFVYDETTKLISLIANDKFLDTQTTPIRLFVNNALYQMIQGFPTYHYTNIHEFHLLVQDYYNYNLYNTTYYKMTQQAPSFGLMSDMSGLILTSSLPIQNESTGIQFSVPTDVMNQGQQVSVPILQDFIPTELDISTFSKDIVYNAITPYRQVEMISNSPIYNVNVKAYIQNISGTLTQTQMPPYASANIKLMFTKKKDNKYA
jgi:hypothetical protein